MTPKEVFDKLLQKAHSYAWRMTAAFSSKTISRGKPGELIEKLSEDERAALQGLTSKDVSNPERHILNYIVGLYPSSNNVTVHTHSISKKEEK